MYPEYDYIPEPVEKVTVDQPIPKKVVYLDPEKGQSRKTAKGLTFKRAMVLVGVTLYLGKKAQPYYSVWKYMRENPNSPKTAALKDAYRTIKQGVKTGWEEAQVKDKVDEIIQESDPNKK